MDAGASGTCLRGCYLQTPYGWGICIGDDQGSPLVQVALNWQLRSGKRVDCSVRREDIQRKSICAAGACVQTVFGTGVVLGFRPEDGIYKVQMWGPLGSGRNHAFLRADALLAVIPAAAGLLVETPYGTGLCRKYYPEQHELVGQKHQGKFHVVFPWGSAFLRADSVQCPMALTLPLIDRFLDRASDLFKMHSGSLARLREALNGLGLERLQEKFTASASEAIEIASKMWDEWEGKEAKFDAKSVVDSIKLKADEVLADPQMRSVFEAGISRLNMLVSKASGFDGEWIGKGDKAPRCRIQDAVMTWHWGEESELEIWAKDSISTDLSGEIFRGSFDASSSELSWTDGDVWIRKAPPENEDQAHQLSAEPAEILQESLKDLRKIVGSEKFEGDIEEAMQTLSRIAVNDNEVQKIVDEMRKRQEIILQLRGEVLQSKAGQVLQEGQERLKSRLVQLQETEISPQLEQMQQRGQRFLTRLSTDKKAKNKAMELFTKTQSRIMDRLNDPNDPHRNGIEAWVTSVKDHVVGQLSAHRALLVESLGGFNLQDVDLRQIIANSWNPVDLEKQLAMSLVKGIKLSGIKSSGTELLETFESSDAVAQIPVLQQTYRGILTVVDDLGIEVPEAMRRLLEAQAAGHSHDMDTWKAAVLKSLDDEGVVKGASDLVKHGEKLIEQFQGLKTSKTVAQVMEHFENEDIERTLLSKLHGLDTEAMLNSAEGALTNAEAREALVSQLKDICLDFILRILPAINIEKISGNDNGCDWELNDINFSDFHFRKENVHITLGDPRKPGEELLRVSAWDISAHFHKLKVFVERTEFPPVKADCLADAKAERMSVAFAFNLVPGAEGSEWKIAMKSRIVNMENLELWVANTGFAAIINTLTFLFADQLKGYASQKIAKHLDEHMGTLITALNTAISTCVPLLQKLGWKLPQLSLDGEESLEAVEVSEAEAEAITSAKDLDWPVIDWADPGRTFAVRI
jgi:hypothetical protein